ncbi:hypothetical protein FOXB_00112, partial [Fusarium oxysporum f. sp. conglutinans Fo5176]
AQAVTGHYTNYNYYPLLWFISSS